MKAKTTVIGLCAFFFLAMCGIATVAGPAQAAYPEKPITIIVPNAAGGGTDGLARAYASRLEKELGQPVVVDNQDGAGGRKGTISLFKSEPDGYTIGLPHFAVFLYDDVLGQNKPPIDYHKFEVIMRADTTVFYIYAGKKTGFKTIDDLKKAGRPIKMGSSGVGNPAWLQGNALALAAGFKVAFVTGHKSLSEVALGVARGDLDAGTGSYTHFQGVLDDVTPIVYMSDEKPYHLPDVPTVAEAGYPKLGSMGVPWTFAAPPGTPKDRVEVIRKAMTKIGKSEEFVKWATGAGYNPSTQGPDAFWKSMTDMREVYEGLKPLFEKK